MKDAKGHGSDARGGQKAAAQWRAAHQSGIGASVPDRSKAAEMAKLAVKLYLAQAAAGAAVGGAIPWLRFFGVM